MNAIRTVLSEAPAKKPRKRLPDLFPTAEEPAPAPPPVPTLQPVVDVETKMTTARFTTVPTPEGAVGKEPAAQIVAAPVKPTEKETKEPKKASIPSPGAVARKVFRMPRLPKIDATKPSTKTPREPKTVRPAPKRLLGKGHILALAAIVLLAFRPGLVLAAVFFWFVGIAALFLVFGAPRVWRGASWLIQAYSRRNKKGADDLLDWLDSVAVRWDSVLDRFPDGLVDGLYMPDFANLEGADEKYDAVLEDRLNKMHSQV